MTIRNSSKAIIIQDGKLLTIKFSRYGNTYYNLPGGGQENGETLHQALIRECKEEIGAEVEIGELIFVREYIGANHELSMRHTGFQQTEFLFSCKLKEPKSISEVGYNPDKGQVGLEWIKVEDLLNYSFYPMELRETLINYSNGIKTRVYVGDIN